jgi:hypothetical protein
MSQQRISQESIKSRRLLLFLLGLALALSLLGRAHALPPDGDRLVHYGESSLAAPR